MLSLEVPLEAEGLEQAQDRIEVFLDERGVADPLRYKVRLVLDELAANLGMHGRFAGPPPPLRVEVAPVGEGVSVSVEDAAEPFDPRLAPPPAGPPSLDDDRVGGLGLALVMRMARIVDYRRLAEGWNRTELLIPRG